MSESIRNKMKVGSVAMVQVETLKSKGGFPTKIRIGDMEYTLLHPARAKHNIKRNIAVLSEQPPNKNVSKLKKRLEKKLDDLENK